MKKPKTSDIPELNGVANAVTVLQFLEMQNKSLDNAAKEAIGTAIKELKMHCKFVKEFQKNPMFWHEFKELQD